MRALRLLALALLAGLAAPVSSSHAYYCGNGQIDGSEECDDGNRINGDGCTWWCTLPVCGDRARWSGYEDCDDGNDSDTDRCLNDCRLARCGDGVLFEGVEQCDDGNTASGDACPSSCNAHRPCGDAAFDGKLTLADPLYLIRCAFSVNNRDLDCPNTICDVDGGGAVQLTDALAALRAIVGYPDMLRCKAAQALMLRISAAVSLRLLRLRVDFPNAAVEFPSTDGLGCQDFLDGPSSFTRTDDASITMEFHASGTDNAYPYIARCPLVALGPTSESDFDVVILEAEDLLGEPVHEGVRIRAIPW